MKRPLLYLLLLLPTLLCAQRHTINGYVRDAQSGERLIGAAIVDTVSRHGAITNNAGFYTLTLPEGEHVLQVCYVGYHPSHYEAVVLDRDTFISFTLTSNTRLEEVTVIGHQSISGPQSAQMSAIEVPISQIKGIPAIGGEVDILKAIQLLPGVQSGGEGSTGIYVRGGGPDENLILLDGVPLYNVSHLMGFFSVFNADALKTVTLYKGNFPARYGSRLSSVIDVRQNDGNATGYHGNISVGLLSAKLNVEGPIYWNKADWKRFAAGDTIRAKTTFNISARRTYFDLFTAPLIALVAKTAENLDATGGYYFYDLNAKFSHTFSENDRLSASFYMGDDVMYMHYGFKELSQTNRDEGKINVRMGWGNIVAAANWEHRYGSRLFSNTQVAFTRYRYNLSESLHEEYWGINTYEKEPKEESYNFDQSMGYKSNIYDVSANTHFEFTPNPKHTINFGAEFVYHQFQPSVSNFFMAEMGSDFSFRLDTTVLGGKLMRGYEANVYFEDSYAPWSWLKLNMGFRGSVYHTGGKTYPAIEPRVGARALITKDLAFKASYSYTSQYVHLLSNSSVTLPTDLWVPVTAHIPPMHSMIAAAGLSYDILGQVEVSVEGYYKRMKNLIEYKDGATFFGSSTGWEDKVVVGDGWSYGVELLVQRKVGPVTGWIGYTWSRTMRQFNREGQEINFGKPFHAKYDREHDLSITLQYEVTKKVDLAATFVYGTGQRATLGTQYYNDPTADDGNVPAQNRVIRERNNYVMPDYHRLDLGATFHLPHRKSGNPALSKGGWLTNAEHQIYVGVYNTYCRMNPYMLYESGGKLYQISLFPILPSISYNFKF